MTTACDVSKSKIRIPKVESDITPEWIAEVTGKTPLNNTISVTGNIQEGVGFLSNLCRVTFKTQEKNDQGHEHDHSILVKLLPENPEFRSLTIQGYMDQREIQFYSEVKPKLLEVDPTLEENLCEYFFSSYEPNHENEMEHRSMLIIEDLKPEGYIMFQVESSEWKENVAKMVRSTAKIHAAAKSLEFQRNKKISQLFPFCLGVRDDDALMFLELAHSNCPKIGNFLPGNGNSPGTAATAGYKVLSDNIEKVFQRIFQEGAKFPCLLHGDIWPPNLMINGDTEKPLMFIDWQILSYRDATYELSVALLCCLPKSELRTEVIDEFAKMYYAAFQENCKTNEKPEIGNEIGSRSETEFLQFFRTWGMSYAYLWFMLSIDSFPNDAERLSKVFLMLGQDYKVCDFLSEQLKL